MKKHVIVYVGCGNLTREKATEWTKNARDSIMSSGVDQTETAWIFIPTRSEDTRIEVLP